MVAKKAVKSRRYDRHYSSLVFEGQSQYTWYTYYSVASQVK